jgi:hypothetical protein
MYFDPEVVPEVLAKYSGVSVQRIFACPFFTLSI